MNSNKNRLIATVAVESTFFNLDGDYDYLVPESHQNIIAVGCEVTVPFGRSNSLRRGIVIELCYGINSALKEIDNVLSKVLDDDMILLGLWLKERCFCTTYDCLIQMLPKGHGKISSAGEKMVELIIQNENELPKLTPKQKLVTDLLFDVGTASANEIKEFCSVGDNVLKNLEKYSIIRCYKKEIYRNPFSDIVADKQKEEIVLTKQQSEAYNKYCDMLCSIGGEGLLFGVTGSGKTSVYLCLIDKALELNKDVIVMVPEIGLTPQMLDIFHSRYGKKVAVLHSGLSIGERSDEYKRADRGEAKIVVGTRSAVFAPLHNLGLIIMDEEQESSYKSERTPRYNARDVARFRCKQKNALFLMTSATPSVETYSNAQKGKYVLCKLSERYGNASLPKVLTVDMKSELKSGNHSPISNCLKELMIENFENNKQTILLINRRGYNTFIACNDCGHVVTCPNCSISLTYHSYSNRLMCHYCGFSKPLDNICPECGGNSVRYSGYGTQRIEDEITSFLPDARILRMDADTTSAKFSHKKLFTAFAAQQYDVLVGTQMVAKGLDFDNVTLVGVVNADNSLYDENYLSNERSFNLITQVIGRSGRRDNSGKAVIQTINPNNPVIEYASNQDYESFFATEYQMRKIMTYPPFCDIYSVSFVSEDENNTALCAKAFFEILVKDNEDLKEKLIVLGPSAAKISKISNNYRYRLAIKCKNSKSVRSLITVVLKNVSKMKEFKKVMISVDLNPFELN